jgi:hypothetical protein
MANEDTSERCEAKAFDEHRCSRERRRSRTECVLGPADETAWNEKRPAFDVGCAREQTQRPSGEDDPGRPVAGGGTSQANREERRDSELRDGKRGCLPDRHERQQRRGRQDHAHDLLAGPQR